MAHDASLLPYFDESVHFPDFRLEYELDGRERYEDIEVVTEHYRGAHAASVARAGFTCYGRGGGGARSGGRPFDPRDILETGEAEIANLNPVNS